MIMMINTIIIGKTECAIEKADKNEKNRAAGSEK